MSKETKNRQLMRACSHSPFCSNTLAFMNDIRNESTNKNCFYTYIYYLALQIKVTFRQSHRIYRAQICADYLFFCKNLVNASQWSVRLDMSLSLIERNNTVAHYASNECKLFGNMKYTFVFTVDKKYRPQDTTTRNSTHKLSLWYDSFSSSWWGFSVYI